MYSPNYSPHSKSDPMLLGKGVATAFVLLEDQSVNVVKRAVQASIGLYRQAIVSLAKQQRLHSPKVGARALKFNALHIVYAV